MFMVVFYTFEWGSIIVMLESALGVANLEDHSKFGWVAGIKGSGFCMAACGTEGPTVQDAATAGSAMAVNTKDFLVQRSDAFVILMVTVVTCFTDLAVSVGCGIVVCSVVYSLHNAKLVKAHSIILEGADGLPGKKVYELDGDLFFGE